MMRRRLILIWLAFSPWAWGQTGDHPARSIYQGPLEQRVDAIAAMPNSGEPVRRLPRFFP